MTSFSRRAAITAALVTGVSLATPNLARAATRRLRLGHNNITASPVHVGAAAFAHAIASLSDGRLALDVFPNAQLGTEKQTTQAVAEGTLDSLISGIGAIAFHVKDASLVELPYLFGNVAAARSAFDGVMGTALAERLKAKSVLLAGWGELGVRHVTANKPVRNPADVKGLKIRVQNSEPTIQTLLAMGAMPETMDFAQVIEALRTGRFDAQENPVSIIKSNDMNLVQSHLSLTAHVYSPGPILFSNDVFEELSLADQVVIYKAGAAATKAIRDYNDEADKNGIDQLRAAGMTIVQDIDRAAFRKSAEEAVAKLEKIYGAEALDRVRKYGV